MPRKKIKIEAEPVVEEVVSELVVETPQAVNVTETVQREVNPHVKEVEINGKRYYQIYNPVDGTTTVELIN